MNYTHRIEIDRLHPWLRVLVTDSFHTTSDAVAIHRAALRTRMSRGDILTFRIVKL